MNRLDGDADCLGPRLASAGIRLCCGGIFRLVRRLQLRGSSYAVKAAMANSNGIERQERT